MIVAHDRVAATLGRLAAPIATALVADQVLGIADTIVIGSFGPAALAAVAAAAGIFATIAISLTAFTAGPRIMGAQAVGAADLARFGRIVRASFVVPVCIALTAGLLGLLFAQPLVHAMLPRTSTADAGADYLMIRGFSLVPMVVSAIIMSAFGAAGDTSLFLRTLVVINVVHIPLLLVLALGLGTHHPLGLAGAGLSSLTSEAIGMGFCLYAALRRPALRICATPHIDAQLVRATASLGWPEFVFLVMLIVPEPVTVALLAPLGVRTVAAFRALSLVSDVTWAIPGSIGSATEIVIGQRLGARDLAGARAFRSGATRAGTRLGLFVGTAVALTAWPLTALVTLNTAIAGLAAAPLAAHAMILPLKTYAMTLLAPIRAAGDVRFTMWMGIATSLFALAGISLGIRTLHFGLWSVPFAWAVAWLVRSALTRARLRSGGWETRRLAA